MQTAWFKSRMLERGLRQEAVGAMLGLDRSQVSRIVNGKQPVKLSEVETLAEALGVSVLEIIWRAWPWKDRQMTVLARAWEKIPADRRQLALSMLETIAFADQGDIDAATDPPARRAKGGR